MNTRLRLILLIIGLATVAGLLILLAPKVLGIYYQIKGGQVLNDVLDAVENRMDTSISCQALPLGNEEYKAKVEESLDLLEQALQYDAWNAQANLYLGRVYCLLNDPTTAAEYYRDYTELRPKNPLGFLEISFAYEAQCLRDAPLIDAASTFVKGWRQCADQELRDNMLAAWEASGVTAQNLLENGRQEEKKERYGRALLWYGRANSMQPDWADPYYRSGLIFNTLEDWSSATRLLQLAITKKPGDRDVWYELGLAQEGLEKWSQAIESYEKALASSGEVGSSNIYYRIGRIKEYSFFPRDNEGALEAFGKALALDNYTIAPRLKANTFYERGVIFLRQGRLDDSIEQFETALSQLPNHYLARIGLANALWRNGQAEEAESVAVSAIQLNPLDTRAYNILGNFYLETGDLTKAEEMYRNVLELDPNDENANNGMNAINNN